jgi:hypothetical protein
LQKWEYLIGQQYGQMINKKTMRVTEANGKKYSSITDMCNDLGPQGWELVNVIYANFRYLLFFKRLIEG